MPPLRSAWTTTLTLPVPWCCLWLCDRVQPVPGAGGRRCDKAAALAAADTLVELLDTFGVELPEPKVELPLGLLGVAAGLVAYTGDDVDEAAAKILEARAEARAAKNWDLADAIRDQLKDLA